jgi:seryl-tRNA synthetase
MLDVRWIRENPEALDAALKRRGARPLSAEVVELDSAYRKVQTRLEEMKAERNALSRKVGEAKGEGPEAKAAIEKVAALKEQMKRLEQEARAAKTDLDKVMLTIPNTPEDEVPDGADESGNKELRRFMNPIAFLFEEQNHVDLGERLGLLDLDTATLMSGARFSVLYGALARLERALAAFMLDMHTEENGYTEVSVPYLVRDTALIGTGQLPKFADDLFRTTDERWLIPTAEVPLANIVRERILREEQLPMRLVACTPCFRSEAGAAGKDTQGMIRQHQFHKVEMVSVVKPEDSAEELERMTECAEKVLQKLQIPYRTVELCTGELGFASRRTYDVEVWLTGSKAYREISSCSNCGDFQARRMDARYRLADEETGTHFVHTLNGSGLAVGRLLVSLMENYQAEDGSISLPTALVSYMGGVKRIHPHET